VLIKLSGIPAASHEQAVLRALEQIGPELSMRFKRADADYAEEMSHYLVDVADDEIHRESRWFYSADQPLLALLQRLLVWDERGRCEDEMLARLIADARSSIACAI
jgi:hypothetical protein